MKKIIYLVLFTLFLQVSAQVYPSQNISLVGHISPNTSTFNLPHGDQKYSGCWGWFQASKNKEYAISGGTNGTYFIDISSPATPTVCDYVAGKSTSTWREIKTYQNYCYVVSDQTFPNTLQIIDMQYLPDSVHIAYEGDDLFYISHTIWIDNDKLYCGAPTHTNSNSSLAVYSLATPTAPVLLRKLQQDYPFVSYVHDMYTRNDTIFASCGYQGLYLFQLTASNTFTQLGSFTNYASGSSYNHSSFLTQNGKYLLFCDEVPPGKPIRIVDVQNFSNIVQTSTTIPYPQSTPHNPYLIGNDLAIISCYQEGLMVYNISNPSSPYVSGYFDTYPQGGAPSGTYSNSPYRGNWGAYVDLPSGLIVANDMQNGVFILDPSAAYANTVAVNLPTSTVGLDNYSLKNNFAIFPNPALDKIRITYASKNEVRLQITSILGELVFEKTYKNGINESLWISELESGTYFIKLSEEDNVVVQKFIVQH